MSEPLNVVPVIPLRDVVIYPSMTLPLNVGRKKSIEAVKQASNNYNNYILLATQKWFEWRWCCRKYIWYCNSC